MFHVEHYVGGAAGVIHVEHSGYEDCATDVWIARGLHAAASAMKRSKIAREAALIS